MAALNPESPDAAAAGRFDVAVDTGPTDALFVDLTQTTLDAAAAVPYPDLATEDDFAAVALATEDHPDARETGSSGVAADDADSLATPERIAERLSGMDARLIADHDPATGYKLICPECHAPIARQEGCQKCHSCGWAAC